MSDGHIELICGCMFSGKTTALIERVAAHSSVGDQICLKPAIDDRYSESDIVSHDGNVLHAEVVTRVAEIPSKVRSAAVVAIDEVHFFGMELIAVCQHLADRGCIVLCTGLDYDMWGDPFPQIQALQTIAQTTVMRTQCAACAGIADRTHRKVPLVGGNVVGGGEAFEPRCQSCFSPPESPKPVGHTPGIVD